MFCELILQLQCSCCQLLKLIYMWNNIRCINKIKCQYRDVYQSSLMIPVAKHCIVKNPYLRGWYNLSGELSASNNLNCVHARQWRDVWRSFTWQSLPNDHKKLHYTKEPSHMQTSVIMPCYCSFSDGKFPQSTYCKTFTLSYFNCL